MYEQSNLPALDQPSGIPGKRLFEFLGYFWKRIFKDSAVIRADLSATGIGVAQYYLNYIEWLNSVSVHDIPVFHRELWNPVVIKKSQKNTGAGAVLKYGDGSYYGPQPYGEKFQAGAEFEYGGFGQFSHITTYPYDGDVTEITGFICDTPVNPATVFLSGKDFVLRDGTLLFLSDPFENDNFARRQILDAAGDPVDEEIILWASNTLFDYENLRRNFGDFFEINIPTSNFYQKLLAQLWDTCRQGSGFSVLEALLATMGGIPFVLSAEETVQIITNRADTGELQIITDKNVYTYPAESEAVVVVGDIVTSGQILTDGIEILDLSKSGKWWLTEDIITLGEGIIDMADFSAELFAKNEFAPVRTTGPDGDGHYAAEIKIYGNSEDVELFWTKVRAREAAAGVYLAEALGVTTETTKLINPMDFFFENFFSNNSCMVRVKTNRMYYPGYFNSLYSWFKRLTPSHVNIFLFIQQDIATETYDLDAELDPDFPIGVSDTLQNISRAVTPDLLVSQVNPFTGPNTELTYRQGTVTVRQIPSCN